MQTNYTQDSILNPLEDIWQKYLDVHDERIENDSNLYHYTTADGLIGILSSDSIHATDINFVNDLSEVTYALQILEGCKNNLIHTFSSTLVTKLLEMVFVSLQQLKFVFRPFVASFCEEGNLLSQWRAYAANGGGFAIGFDKKSLLKVADPQIELYKIKYDDKTQKSLLENGMRIVCENLISSFVVHDYRADNIIVDVYQPVLSRWLAKCLLGYKNPLFKEEKEWRLVYLPTIAPVEFEKMGFATDRGKIKPYMKLKLPMPSESQNYKLPISEIVYGPTYSDQIEDSLTFLIIKYGYPAAAIKGSGIPLSGCSQKI